MFLRTSAHALISTLTLISLHPQGHNINQLHTSNKPPPPSFLTFLKSRDTRKTCFYCYLFQIFSNVNYNRFSTGGQFIFHLVLPSSMCLQSSFKCIICSFGFFFCPIALLTRQAPPPHPGTYQRKYGMPVVLICLIVSLWEFSVFLT